MNQKKAYEQTIAVKLEAIPLPDMADAIWARIENQLDIDMPTDDGGGNSTPDAPSGFGWIGGSVLFVFAVALVSFFIINNNNKNKQTISRLQTATALKMILHLINLPCLILLLCKLRHHLLRSIKQ